MKHGDGAAQEHVRVNPDKLRLFVANVLKAAELPEPHAETVATILVEADLRGVDSHGTTRLSGYIQMLRAGLINPYPKVQVLRETQSTAILEGDKAFGMVVAKQAMEMAMAKAENAGIACVTARNITHTGMVGYYPMMAAARGMIGLAMNNGPCIVPPYGGTTPVMATNPISVAFPAGKELPIVLDMATTMVAGGKFRLAAKKGMPVPDTWALDRDGRPTTDPNEAIHHGFFQWAGAYKGFGMALMVEVLGAVLSGGLVGQDVPPLKNFGKDQLVSSGFYMTINVQHFMPLEEFTARVDRLVRQVKSSKPAAGVEEVYLSGEIEFHQKARRLREGIPLSTAVYQELKNLSQELRVPLDLN